MNSTNENFYFNPVVRRDFPDPFVFKFNGEYWAICTGFWHDGGVFGLLKSRNLVHWTDCGSAINPPPFADAPCWWAPEIFYDNGKFYLYYSVGNEEFMEIRVAVADLPQGKYVDSGHKLTEQQFAIDAHVFVDDDDSRWLFYATDFLEHSHIGTGTMRDKMLSPFELAGNPQPVTRARFDWQVYDPNRASKGGVRWHTIEGSAVLKRKNLYYQMFSGGNWQNISYGVSYATTGNLETPDEWRQMADGEAVLPILRTIPERVIGPGHNSVVRGADNRQLFCVYHRWAADLSGRQMAIDPLDFAGEKMFVLGASDEPQPAPNAPTVRDFFDDKESYRRIWGSADETAWRLAENCLISNPENDNAEAVCRFESNNFLVEISAKVSEFAEKSGYGFRLKTQNQTVLRCRILPAAKQVELFERNVKTLSDLPADFDPQAFHLWRIEIDNLSIKIRLDEANFRLEKILQTAPDKFALSAQNCTAAFAGFALTEGFENLFTDNAPDLTAHGWQQESSSAGVWKIADNLLKCNSFNGEAKLVKNSVFADFEFVINARLSRQSSKTGSYGFILRENSDAEILLEIETDNVRRVLRVSDKNGTKRFALPRDFSPFEFEQFRFRLRNGILHLQCGINSLGEINFSSTKTQIGLFVSEAEADFDMVRTTQLRITN